MASKAIYSEVIELLLSVEKFEQNIASAKDSFERLYAATTRKITLTADAKDFIGTIDMAIAKERELSSVLREQNQIIAERRNAANGLLSKQESSALAARIKSRTDMSSPGGLFAAAANITSGGDIEASRKALDGILAAEATATVKRTAAESAASVTREASMRGAALAEVERRKTADLVAGNQLAAERLDKQIADARRARSAEQVAANDKEASHQSKLLANEKTRHTDLATFLQKQADGRGLEERALRSETAIRKAEYRLIIESENERTRVMQAAILLAKEEATIRVKNTAGYKVGSFASGTRVGAALDIAAGAGFAVGGANIGGAIYMMERFAYATGVGQKSLGELAAKFNLVKLEGDGAAASISKFGGLLIAGGTIAAATVAVAGLAIAGRDANRELALMSTLLAPVSTGTKDLAAAIDTTSAAAGRIAIKFGTSYTDTIKGFYDALSTGIDGKNLEQFGNTAATVSRGLNTSFESSVNILTTLKDAYGAALSDLPGYADILFNAIDVGKFNVKDLQANLGRVAVSAAEAGVSIKDMFGALAGLNRAGLSTSQSVTSLNRYIQGIVDPTNKARTAMDKLGIAYGSAAFKGRALADQIEELRTKTGGDVDLISEIVGTEQGRRGANILVSLPALMAETRGAMEATGSAAVAASRAMNTFGENLYKIWQSISIPIQQVGSDFLNFLNTMMFGGETATNGFKRLEQVVRGVALAFEILGAIVVTAVKAIVSAISVVVNAVSLVIDAVTFSGKQMYKDMSNIYSAVTGFVADSSTAWGRMLSSYDAAMSGITSSTTDAVEASTIATTNFVAKAMDASTAAAEAASKALSDVYDKMAKKSKTTLDILLEDIRTARAAALQAKVDSVAVSSKATEISADERYAKQKLMALQYKKEVTTDPQELASLNATIAAQRRLISEYETDRAAKDAYNAFEDNADRVRNSRNAASRAGLSERNTMTFATSTDAEVSTMLAAREQMLAQSLVHLQDSGLKAGAVLSDAQEKFHSEQLQAAIFNYNELQKTVTSSSSLMTKTDYEMYQNRLESLYEYVDKYSSTYMQAIDKSDELKKTAADKDAAREKAAAEKRAKAYEADYNAAFSIWNKKLSLYDKELKKIDAISTKLADARKEIASSLFTSELEVRNDPSRSRRAMQGIIEERMERTRNEKDPSRVAELIVEIKDMTKQLQQYGDAEGISGRTSRMVVDILKELDKEAARAEQANNGNRASPTRNKEAATREFNAAVANNPVAKATMDAVLPVVTAAVQAAARNGLGVTGDLNSKVDIKSIDINLPVSDITMMIDKGIKAAMYKYISNAGKGVEQGVETGSNIDPVGAATSTGASL